MEEVKLQLTETELLRYQNLQLSRQNLAHQARSLEQTEASLAQAIQERLGGVDLNGYAVAPDGVLTKPAP